MVMERLHAEHLIARLQDRVPIQIPHPDTLVDLLVHTDIPDSSRFCRVIPENWQTVTETNDQKCYYKYYQISIRRVLRNKNAELYSPSWVREFQEGLMDIFGIRSSDHITRKLREDASLVKSMRLAPHPYSLLAVMATYDFDNPDNQLFKVVRPVLVIPEFSSDLVESWEIAHTNYFLEKGLLRRLVAIPKEQYLGQ